VPAHNLVVGQPLVLTPRNTDSPATVESFALLQIQAIGRFKYLRIERIEMILRLLILHQLKFEVGTALLLMLGYLLEFL
jgi:hypothetical protein